MELTHRVRWFESAVGHALAFYFVNAAKMVYNIANESEPWFRIALSQTDTVTGGIGWRRANAPGKLTARVCRY